MTRQFRFAGEVVDCWRCDGEFSAVVIDDNLTLRVEVQTPTEWRRNQRVEVIIRHVKEPRAAAEPYSDLTEQFGVSRVASAMAEMLASCDRFEPSEARERLLEILKHDGRDSIAPPR